MLAEKLEEQTFNWIIPTDPCSQNQAYQRIFKKNPPTQSILEFYMFI